MSDQSYDTPDDWTHEQEALFIRLYRHMLQHKALFMHPAAPEVKEEHWDTTAWNAAYCAAAMLKAGALVHVTEQEEYICTESSVSN